MAYTAFFRSPPSSKKDYYSLCRLLALVIPSPFQVRGEISPGKNAILHRTTAGFMLPPFDHKSFAVYCPHTLADIALHPILVHRLTASTHAISPHSVPLMQLRSTSFAMISSRRDFYPRDCGNQPACHFLFYDSLVIICHFCDKDKRVGKWLITYSLKI